MIVAHIVCPPSCALPASVLQVGTAMGRGPQANPAFAKIFAKADRQG